METQYIDWLATSPALISTELTIAVGAYLISSGMLYTHHGIYTGNGQVIRYGGFIIPRNGAPLNVFRCAALKQEKG